MSFWVTFWISRVPLGYNVSRPLCAGPLVVATLYDAISWLLSTLSPLYQA